ncbi:MAG TPA: shikimate kinase, partial [Candidatus Limnocylindria bacterium]
MPDGVVLVGMPTSGKSTVGRLVADRLGRRFIDTDELAGRRIGMPVAAYIERNGEAGFRAVEAEAVREACAVRGAVIATGGGAVLEPLNRWELWHHGTVAWLDPPADMLLERLRADDVARPTLEPYGPERLAAVLAERAPMYRAADVRLEGVGSPGATAERLIAGLEPRTGRRLFDAEVARHHSIGPSSARIVMGIGVLDALPSGAAIVDRRLLGAAPDLVKAVTATACLAVRAGERSKRIRSLERILEWLAEQRVERDTP